MKAPSPIVCATLLCGFGLLMLLTSQTPPAPPLEQTLYAVQGKKRVLLVAAPTAANADFQAQRTLLAGQQAQLDERDFLVINLAYDRLSTADKQFFARKTGLNSTSFSVVLIGKDGGVKLTSARPISSATLFGTVDQMPMRRREMRRGAVQSFQ